MLENRHFFIVSGAPFSDSHGEASDGGSKAQAGLAIFLD